MEGKSQWKIWSVEREEEVDWEGMEEMRASRGGFLYLQSTTAAKRTDEEASQGRPTCCSSSLSPSLGKIGTYQHLL